MAKLMAKYKRVWYYIKSFNGRTVTLYNHKEIGPKRDEDKIIEAELDDITDIQ